jgi:hypothetical protein
MHRARYIALTVPYMFTIRTCCYHESLLVASYKEAPNRTIAMDISAEVRIKVEDRIHYCFYPRHGHYDGIGKQLWFFLEQLSIAQWKRMEERLREEVKWYVNLSYDSVDDLISLIVNIG